MAQNQHPASYSGAQKRNPFDNIVADDDEFGDFTSAVSFTPSLNGGFHSAPPPVTANGSIFFNPLQPTNQDEIEDDEFGEFCAQPSVRIEESVVVPSVKCQPNYDIDLEIDSCLSWSGPSSAIATVQQQLPEQEIEEEEEFSQFTSASELPSEAPVDLLDSQPVNDDLFTLTNDVDSLLVLETTSTVVAAVQVATDAVEDEFGDFEQATINEQHFPGIPFEPLQEAQEMSPTEEEYLEQPSVHVASEYTDPVPVVEPSPQPQKVVEEEKEEDDFGDFTGFQAAEQVVAVEQVEDDDDEFDDFEVAPPPPVALVSAQEEDDVQQTPEIRLKRLLNNIFPYTEPVAVATSPTCPLSPLSSRGALWSYVRQLDSTPALSFQWRHSTAHQRFLNSLKIDSIQQQGPLHPAKWHWPSPTSSANSSSVGDGLSESSMSHTGPTVSALDLDFFLNPSNTGTASTSTVNADSLLESIERELLSSPTKTIASTVQSPPVHHHHHHQMDDIWGHHQSTAQGPPATAAANVLDLLN